MSVVLPRPSAVCLRTSVNSALGLISTAERLVIPTPDSGASSPMRTVDPFLRQLAENLAPHLQECFSEETKSLRNVILGLGSVILLLSLGTISIGNDAEVWVLKVTINARDVLLKTGAFIEGFFLSVLLARCFVEWNAWKLKLLAPQWSLANLSHDLTVEAYARAAREAQLRNELLCGSVSPRRADEIEAELKTIASDPDAVAHAELSGLYAEKLTVAAAVRRLRFGLEVFVPIAFGAFATVTSLVR